MVRNHRPLDIDINQTLRLRREAAGLLRRLQANQQSNEQVCAEIGKRDAMRSVTGCSAIERAIETTRGMIRDMDHLLREFADEFGEAPVDPSSTADEHTHHAKELVESR